MRPITRIFAALALAAATLTSACTAPQPAASPKPETWLARDAAETQNLPKITQVLVRKEDRKLYLLHKDQVVRAYDVDLGFAPEGHKTRQGDGRTPEGLYYIDRRNAQSTFYKSIGISYPSPADRARAQARGENPGGDIFIHGESRWAANSGTDWTRGCIALPDRQMAEIFDNVAIGTPIMITK